MRPEAPGTHANRPTAPHRLPRCESNEAYPTYISPRPVKGALQRSCLWRTDYIARHLRESRTRTVQGVDGSRSRPVLQRQPLVCEKPDCCVPGEWPSPRYRVASIAAVSVNASCRSCSSPGPLPRLGSGWSCNKTYLLHAMPIGVGMTCLRGIL